jgi:biopolymer transport protein ExbD
VPREGKPVVLRVGWKDERAVLRLEGEAVTEEQFTATLQRYRKDGRNELVIEAGREVPVGTVVRLEAAARAAGIDTIRTLVSGS